METSRCDQTQIWKFPFFAEPSGPHRAPLDEVAEWDCELDAVRYSVSYAIRRNRRLTQMQLADDMRWSRANLTKVLQDQAAMPRESSQTFIEHTDCLALQQYRNMAHGLITKTVLKEREDQELLQSLTAKNTQLEAEIAQLEGKIMRMAGAY